MATEITLCRICKNTDLTTVYDLGFQGLSSRFPSENEPEPLKAPLKLVKCNDSLDDSKCG